MLSLGACRGERVCKCIWYQSVYSLCLHLLKSSGSFSINITNLFLLNPAENPQLIPTFFILIFSNIVRIREWLESHTLLTCRLATGVAFMGFLVVFFFPFFFYCFSLITTKTSLSQDFLLSIFLLLSFISTESPVRAAAW